MVQDLEGLYTCRNSLRRTMVVC